MHRGRHSGGGYTILEIMIFLSISMFMFVIAAVFIQGKQTKTQFTQAMNSINSQVQQMIEDVSDNNYEPTNLSCVANGSNISISSSGSQQGANGGCSYLGEVVQFGVNGTNGRGYNVYTVAGCQYSGCDSSASTILTDNPPSSFYDARAQVVDPGYTTCNSGNYGSYHANNIQVSLTTCNTLQWGIYATNMYEYDSSTASPPNPPTPIKTNSVGLFGSFAQRQPSGSGLVSGLQSVMIVDPGTNLDISGSTNKDESGMVGAINTYLTNSTTSVGIPDPNFVVCFSDGKGDVGALTIGGGSANGGSFQHLTSSIQIAQQTIYPFGATYQTDVCQ